MYHLSNIKFEVEFDVSEWDFGEFLLRAGALWKWIKKKLKRGNEIMRVFNLLLHIPVRIAGRKKKVLQ